MTIDLDVFRRHYSTSGTIDDRAESFKIAAVKVAQEADFDRPFTREESQALFAAADEADDRAFGVPA